MNRLVHAGALAALVVFAVPGCERDAATQSAAPAPADAPAAASPAPPAPQRLVLSSGARSGTSADGTYTVKWEVVGGTIPDAEPFAIAFAVTRKDGKPVAADAEVFVDAEMPHHGHGMNFVPTVTRQGGDTFLGEGLLFHMPGRWVLAIDIGEDGIRERTQWFVDVE